MRHAVIAIAFAAALVAAAPASAQQRVSLADRVAALEQQAANNRGNVDLLNQVTQLKAEVQALRAQLEELQQKQQQADQGGRNQYLDLDGRLNRLEGGVPTAIPAPVKTPAKPPVPATADRDTPPSVYGDAGTLVNGEGERARYDIAFDALKAGRYADSAGLFQQFLQDYPSGTYAPNALYWLGESYYVTGNFAMAQQQFQALLDRYPTHDKAAGGLLKVGLSQYGQQQLDSAEATLSQVMSRYPDTDAARTAQDRLRAIQLGRVH